MESAAKELGYIDRPTNATDMTFVGLGILLGGIIGALAIHIGGVPISPVSYTHLDVYKRQGHDKSNPLPPSHPVHIQMSVYSL